MAKASESLLLNVHSTKPVQGDDGTSDHVNIQWQGPAASFVLAALEKHGGTFGQFLTDAIRFYLWWMQATDGHSIFMVPHGRTSSRLRTELDKCQGQVVELMH